MWGLTLADVVAAVVGPEGLGGGAGAAEELHL